MGLDILLLTARAGLDLTRQESVEQYFKNSLGICIASSREDCIIDNNESLT